MPIKVVVTQRGVTVRLRKGGPLVPQEVGTELTVSDRMFRNLRGKVASLEPRSKVSKEVKPPQKDTFDTSKAKKEELLAKAKELGLDVDASFKVEDLRELVAEELADIAAESENKE